MKKWTGVLLLGRKSGEPMPYVPDRADVVWLTLSPTEGSEQRGRRPAIVLSPQPYNRRVGLAVVCPITSRVKGYPFEVVIPPGLDVEGAVLSDQVRSVDWRARRVEHMTKLPQSIAHEVSRKLLTLLPTLP